MATSQNLDTIYVDAFRSDILHLYQQTESRLMPLCITSSEKGENHYFDSIDASMLALTDKGKKQATSSKWQEVSIARRQATPVTQDIALPYEWDDIHRIIMNPQPHLQMELVALANKTRDKKIHSALINPALAVIDGAVQAPIPLPASGKITSTKLAIADLIAVKDVFLSREIMNEKITCVLDHKSYSELLEDDKSVNSLFVNDAPISTGELGLRLGFNFVLFNNNANATTSTKRDVVFSLDGSVGLAEPHPLRIEVETLPTESYMWQLYMAQTLGAVRRSEQTVVMVTVGT